MNLLIDCSTTQDQLSHHGIGHYTRELVTHMVAQFPQHHFCLLLFDGATTLPVGVLGAKNVEVVSIGKLRYSTYKDWWAYKRQFEPVIRGLLRKYPDAHYFCPYFWRYFPAKLMPTYVAIHDMALPVFNTFSEQSPLHNLLRKFQYWGAMKGLYNCAGVLADSEYTRKELLRLMPRLDGAKSRYLSSSGGDKVKTVLLGIDLDSSELKESRDEQRKVLKKYMRDEVIDAGYFVYMGGTLMKSKNSEGVVRAYAEFVKAVESKLQPSSSYRLAGLVIAGGSFVGHSAKVENFHRLIESLGIADKVVFTGFYEDSDKPVLLGNSVAFIHLSLYEGFGLAVAEAMACGVPVIAHNGSSYVEVVGDAGILVDGRDAKAVAQRMVGVWEKPQEGKELGEKGRKRVEGFRWERAAEESFEIINNNAL
jgi:glycosyltransferase involved in cell wall biosynthesis